VQKGGSPIDTPPKFFVRHQSRYGYVLTLGHLNQIGIELGDGRTAAIRSIQGIGDGVALDREG
jgi:hypothetical protein